MLQGDDLNCESIVDLLGLHLDGKVLSSNDLVMLLNVNDWEVNSLHDIGKLRFRGGPMLVGQFTIFDFRGGLGSLASSVELCVSLLVVNEYISPLVPLNKVINEI